MNKKYRFVCLAVGVVLTLFVTGKWNIPLAAWVAPVFFLRFYRESDHAVRDFLFLWLGTALAASISWYGATFFPPITSIVLMSAMTLLKTTRYLVDRIYYRRFPSSPWVTLVYPVALTAIDFLVVAYSPLGTFGAYAYTQNGVLPVMQLASVTGLWGITFAIGWTASLVSYLWERGFKFDRFTLASAGLLLTVFLFGLGRTLMAPQPRQNPVVAGFSLPNGTLSSLNRKFNNGSKADFRQAADRLNAEELDQIRMLARQGANIVVTQEASFVGMTDQIQQVIQDASALAREQKIYIVLPTFDMQKSPRENIVRILDPNGQVVLTHIKYGGNRFEHTLKGDGILHTVDTPYGRLSAIICWDADFPNIVRQAGEKHVDLLLLPVNEWREMEKIDQGMAAFRAVENGMTLFRQAGQGISTVIDPLGRELNRIDAFTGNQAGFTDIQVVKTPVGSVGTLYPSMGDAVGDMMSLCLLGLVLGAIPLWRQNRRGALGEVGAISR
jgi:apolipoprotein N-acyltransferase